MKALGVGLNSRPTLRRPTFNVGDKDRDANLSNQTLVNIQIIVFIFVTFNKKYCKLKKI